MKRSRRNRALPDWKWVLYYDEVTIVAAGSGPAKWGEPTRFLLLSLEKRSHAEGFGDTLCSTRSQDEQIER
jgi:hypothetical protein